MILNLNSATVILGCMVLLVFWLLRLKSGLRRFLYGIVGCILLIAAILNSQNDWRVLDLGGIVVAICILALLAVYVRMSVRVRARRRPHYHVPNEMRGSFSKSASSAHYVRADYALVKETEV